MEDLTTVSRSCYCGAPRAADIGTTIVIKGWVHRRRDHGGLIFVDLRDRTGLCQVVFSPESLSKNEFNHAGTLRNEYVLAVRGEVARRPEGTVNPKIPTGEIEVITKSFTILNTSEPPPFALDEYANVSEDTRLRYRFLDLRRPEMQSVLFTRARMYKSVRDYLSGQGFIEVETPMLTRSTPEGARDFIVPSRLSPGEFYALPQSPQLFKQLLMVSGFDKYFQIVRCFRDEDLRANRQPEFTQIDIETSFITRDELLDIMEGMVCTLYNDILDATVERPFKRIPYREAMLKYGSDKPDLRFGMEIHDLADSIGQGCEFKVFTEALKKGGVVRGFSVKGGAAYSRKQIDDFTKFVGIYGAKGLAWVKFTDEGVASPIAKFFTEETLKAIGETCGAGSGDIVFIVADKERIACDALGNLRLQVAETEGLRDENAIALAWVVDFPLMEWNERENRWDPAHHPFTSPVAEDIPLLDTEPQKVRAQAYDLTLNGEEIGGGSIRIHRPDVQQKVFNAIGINEEKANEKFGFLLEALSYGAPPHGGIAFGFDRMVMIFCKQDSIREVIAFPKTQSGTCLLTNAPSLIDDEQLEELCIKTIVDRED